MKKLNGVDVEALREVVETVGKNPAMGKGIFRVKNVWSSGGKNSVTIQDYYAAGAEQKTRARPFVIDADEPPALLGSDTGANPVETLLAALSSCMTTSIAYHAAARGHRINSMSSHFTGELDLQGFLNLSKNVPIGYKSIEATFTIDTDATPEEIEELYKFSPVYNMVSAGVPIKVTLKTSS